eukprot:3756367-Prymnesium_polylepis.1
MTGRGTEPGGYASRGAYVPNSFIDGVTTMNGGIDYQYFDYLKWTLFGASFGWPFGNDEYRTR